MELDKLNRFNISSIETFFDTLLRGTLTDHLFFNELPPVIGKEWEDIVVVDCGNPVLDHDSHAQGTVLIYLYVKQNPYGTKDVKKMQELEKKLNELVLSSSDPYYKISHRGSYSAYGAVNDIYMNIVQISLTII